MSELRTIQGITSVLALRSVQPVFLTQRQVCRSGTKYNLANVRLYVAKGYFVSC
jgi:hypothetical protein